MAFIPRTIAQIQAQIIASKEADSNLSGLTSTSQVSYWRLWVFIQAVAINLLEQIMAIFIGEVETIVASGVPGTAPWIRSEVLKFQYSATTPQVVEVNTTDFTIGYPTVDPTLQIISSCAVVPNLSGTIVVKAATGTTPAPLSSPQVTALGSYLTEILPAGAVFQIISANADTLRVDGTVYYNGQYTATIQASVEAALTAYMAALPFNGVVKVSDIERAILSVAGVTDVTFTLIRAKPDGGTNTDLVSASTELSRSYQTYAGYIVNDGTNPFSSTLTYLVAND